MSFGKSFKSAWNKASTKARSTAAALATGARKVAASLSPALRRAESSVSASQKWAQQKTSAFAGTLANAAKNTAFELRATGNAIRNNSAPLPTTSVGRKAANTVRQVKQAYANVKSVFSSRPMSSPVLPCPQTRKTETTKVQVARNAIKSIPQPQKRTDNTTSADEFGTKLAFSTLKNKNGLRDLTATAANYGKTGYLDIKKGNIFNVAPGRYTANGLATRTPWQTQYAREALRRSAGLGTTGTILQRHAGVASPLIEIGKTLYGYGEKAPNSRAQVVSDVGRAAVKGTAKGVVSSVVIAKSTALGVAIGSWAGPIGMVVGGGVGFVSGVAASVLTDRAIDHSVDTVWGLTRQAVNAVTPQAKKFADTVAAGSKKVSSGALRAWDSVKSSALWARTLS